MLTAFDNFDNFFQTSDKLLPVANLFKIYDEMRFRERFRLSQSVVKCLLAEVNVKLHLFRKFISFHS